MVYTVAGAVDADNFEAMAAAGDAFLRELDQASQTPVRFDLSGLERSNSLAVAMLLAWFRLATDLDKAVEFAQVPADLRHIIEFSGLNDVLPLV